MRWSFVSQQRRKTVGLLLGFVLVILVTAISLKKAVQDMNRTVAALNADRLQPAVDLVYISESVHAKRLTLEDQLMPESLLPTAVLAGQLRHYDRQIENRIGHYAKTKLTAEEARWLNLLNQQWREGKRLDQSIQQLLADGHQPVARRLFNGRGTTVFKQSVESIHELAQIQAETGQRAVSDAHRVAAGGSLDVTLLTAISVLVILVILGLGGNPTGLDPKSTPLHLN